MFKIDWGGLERVRGTIWTRANKKKGHGSRGLSKTWDTRRGIGKEGVTGKFR